MPLPRLLPVGFALALAATACGGGSSTDAGAVRYFSNLPTLDVLGLNTPQMLEPDEAFMKAIDKEALVSKLAAVDIAIPKAKQASAPKPNSVSADQTQ